MPGVPNGTSVPAEVETHGEHHGPELQRTGRCVCVCIIYTTNPPCFSKLRYRSFVCLCRLFGGLIMDVKRKVPFYLSDFRDGLSLQCMASFLFLYCACMSPVITFGGLLGEATEGRIVRTHPSSRTPYWIVTTPSAWFIHRGSVSPSVWSPVECDRVFVRSLDDGRGILSVRRSAAHYPRQHRTRSGVWENPFQVLQVSATDL